MTKLLFALWIALILVCGCLEDNPSSHATTTTLKLASGIEKAEDCRNLESPFEQDFCYYNFAVWTNDSTICPRIHDVYYKEECYGGIGLNVGNQSIINFIGDVDHRNVFYAVFRKNPSICELIANQSYKDLCYYSAGSLLNNRTSCNNVVNKGVKELCFEGMALSLNDSSLCGEIQANDSRDMCYGNVAINSRNLTVCDKLQNTPHNLHDWCYAEVSIRRNDSSICESIQDEGWKKVCYNRGYQ